MIRAVMSAERSHLELIDLPLNADRQGVSLIYGD